MVGGERLVDRHLPRGQRAGAASESSSQISDCSPERARVTVATTNLGHQQAALGPVDLRDRGTRRAEPVTEEAHPEEH